MKRLASTVAALGIMSMVGIASANEYTPGQICQATDPTTVSYSWTQLNAGANGAYAICPIPRTYSSVNAARADVYNPDTNPPSTIGGWLNFISEDGSYTNFNYNSTQVAGNQTLTFAAISNPNGLNGFLNFEMNLPPNGAIRGFYTN